MPTTRLSPSNEKAFGGLLVRRQKWVLIWWAKLLLVLTFIGVAAIVLRYAHDFLALNAPVASSALVIEGWVPRYAVTTYVARVAKDYDAIYTTGGAVLNDYRSTEVGNTFASVARTRLLRAGVPAEKIHVVPCWIVRRDRTYSSALAFKEWCKTNNTPLTAFNVITLGPHARRSRLLHQKAFGADVKVGVIPLTNVEYDPHHWWRYSEGVKETLSEIAAYLYARFLFSPD